MTIEKEYYQYLNGVWQESLAHAANDKELAKIFFEKAASPYHYWKEAQLLANGQPVKKELLTEKQASTIHNFLDKHPELRDELKGCKVEELSKDDASVLIGDWMKRFFKK